ncbi:MAG: cell surface protein [Chitinophagaceae bacterium]|nr:cell surface protein [Chitinophagaceae bacterium]
MELKKIIGILTCLLIANFSFGNHLKGGWIFYEYLGTAGNNSTYRITVKQYLDCGSTPQQIDPSVYLGIFDGAKNASVQNIEIIKSSEETITKPKGSNPCITNEPTICYLIDTYVTTVSLPNNAAGYTLAVQRCCRIGGIVNLTGSSAVGVSYTNHIPGNINGQPFQQNNSPLFAQKDAVLICFNAPFTFDFSATDSDPGDVLRYSFCNGLDGGSTNDPRPNPPSNPPYVGVPYSQGFNGNSPMGPKVTIDSITGIISGIAPSGIGDYVVAVCASEFRNGILIGSTKKEIHITIASCGITSAQLDPVYYSCDSFAVHFQNLSMSSDITSYLWDFGVNNSTSTSPTPTFTYPDTGRYTVQLTVSNSVGCTDHATQQVLVYPVFSAGFMVTGSCFISPYTFTDTSKGTYGLVDKWRWDFGDLTTLADTSLQKIATYQYSSTGDKTVTLLVSNNKGCSKTVTQTVKVDDKPFINLPFKDTLICSIDTLRLGASSSQGSYSWGPAYNIINPNTANPLVYPKVTTFYTVTVNAGGGCVNKDSIKVNVLDFITVDAGADTSICQTDSVRMRTVSQALNYQWTPVTGLNNPGIKFPSASPAFTTKYFVIANLGKCQAKDSVTIRVAPYPQARAGNDTLICFGDPAQLHGEITGAFFAWKPTNTLTGFNTLNPVARPTVNTTYILVAGDTVGCKKIVSDTIFVAVQPKIIAFAGRDTTIVMNQPLQLNATGGTSYFWSPATGLNNTGINNPVATLNGFTDSITYIVSVSSNGCSAQDDITVRIFKTKPDLFVPTAFTPNKDGRNDILKAIPVGIKKFEYLQVYSRWGQLIFQSNDPDKGWDGKFNGIEQASGTYVFVARGIDYLDNVIIRKGTCVLIR